MLNRERDENNMEINLDNVIFERLSPQHNVADFCCGEADVSYHLTSGLASVYQTNGVGTTTIALYNGQVIGFFETRCTEIAVDENIGTDLDKVGLSYIGVLPSIEISAIGVHKDFRKKGIGRLMIRYLLKHTILTKEWLGLSYIFAKAKPNAEEWYIKESFLKTNIETYDNTIPMRLPVPDVGFLQQGLK